MSDVLHVMPNSGTTFLIKKKLASGSGNLVYFWDIDNSSEPRHFKGHKANVSCLETSGGIIISGDEDGNMLLWDRTRPPELLPWSNISGELVSTLPNVHKSSIVCIKYDDDHLASSSLDGTVKVWDLNKVCLKHKFVVTNPEVNEAVSFLQLHGNDLLTASGDGFIKQWDLNSGKCQLSINNGHRVSCLQQIGTYTVYSSSPEEDVIKLWDLRLPARPVYLYPGFEGVNYFGFDGAKFVASAQLQFRVVVCPLSPAKKPLSVWTFPVSIAAHQSILFTSSILVMATSDNVLVYDYDV